MTCFNKNVRIKQDTKAKNWQIEENQKESSKE